MSCEREIENECVKKCSLMILTREYRFLRELKRISRGSSAVIKISNVTYNRQLHAMKPFV